MDTRIDRHVAHSYRRAGEWAGPSDRVTLTYDERFLRRRLLATESGAGLLVDLPETVSLNGGDALVLESGGHVAVAAAAEPLIEVRAEGPDLVRLAWHIGNRHMPAQIEAARILVRQDHVIADMLARLGAATRAVTEPFTPEGGAYGRGRTHGHHHQDAGAPPHGHEG